MANVHETLKGLFSAIADAIRAKTGGTEELVADNFPDAIAAIQTGTELPELTNPGSAAQLLEGYQLIDQSGNAVEGTIPSVEGAAITPGTADQTAISAGNYAAEDITVKGDANLVPENIASGVSIFGVDGTHEGGGFGTVLNYASVSGVLSESNTKVTFAWPNAVNGKLPSIISLQLSASGSTTNVVTGIKDSSFHRLAMQAISGVMATASGAAMVTDIVDLLLKDSSGNNVFDAWCWGCCSEEKVDNTYHGLLVTGDENGLVVSLPGGAITGYDGADYTTALWATNPVLWVYWTE